MSDQRAALAPAEVDRTDARHDWNDHPIRRCKKCRVSQSTAVLRAIYGADWCEGVRYGF